MYAKKSRALVHIICYRPTLSFVNVGTVFSEIFVFLSWGVPIFTVQIQGGVWGVLLNASEHLLVT